MSRATINGLRELRRPEEVARLRGKSPEEVSTAGMLRAYRERNMGDDAVLLLHPGFVADGMLPLLEQPALARFRLIAPHRRGYGRSSPAVPPVSIADLASDIVRLLDALGIERAHLVGHSLGGCVALQVAHAYPDRVGRLALLEPPLGFCLSEASLGNTDGGGRRGDAPLRHRRTRRGCRRLARRRVR